MRSIVIASLPVRHYVPIVPTPVNPEISVARAVEATATEVPATIRAALRALPPTARFLYLGTFLNRFATFVVSFLGLYLLRLGTPVARIGLIVGLYGVGSMIATQIGGWLADHWGRRPTIVLSMCSSAVAVLALSQARTPGLLAVLSFLAGLAGELYRPASSAMLADLTPQGQRVPAFAAYRLAINAGAGMGLATGGLLADHSFTWLFATDAVASVAYATVALVFLRDVAHRPPAPHARSILAGLRALRTDRPFAMLVGASALVSIVFYQDAGAIPLHVNAVGLSAATYGLLMSLNGITCTVLELPFASVTRRLPPRACIAAGVTVIGIGMSLTGYARTPIALAATVVLWSFGEMLSSPVLAALVADIAPTGMQARYQGVIGLTYALGMALAPALGTPAFAWHPGVLWSACAAAGMGAALLVFGSRVSTAQPAATTGAATEATTEAA